MVAGGANTIYLGTTHHFGSFFCPPGKEVSSPEQVAQLEKAVKIMADHYKAKGVFDLHYLQLRDETSEPASLNVYRAVYKDFPDVKVLLTAMSPEARPILDIPCPQTSGFDPGWRDEIKKKPGGEYWWYVCLSPPDPYANLFIHQTGGQHRALFWQTWSHGVEGLLYWGLNYWAGYESKFPADVKMQTTRLPDKDAPVIGGVPGAPGDGFSMYPGPDPATPMSSIRLEAMRDGEEDYEYFVLLDRLIAQAEQTGTKSASLEEARSARDAAKKLVEGLTDYEKSGGTYLQLRERVGNAIEALMKG
jgi:hypothetical protein